MNSIQLTIDARNPGEYLAVCGLVELVGRIDRTATSGWTRRGGMVPEVPAAATDVCKIDAHLDEPKVARELAQSLGARSSWTAVTQSGKVPLVDAVGAWTAGIEILLPGQHDIVVIDHWYEWAFLNGSQIVQRHGKHDGKGRWKLWAGHHDSMGMSGLVLELVDLTAKTPTAGRLQDLLNYVASGSSSFKLDPATTRASLDRGISANDAKDEGKSVLRPALDLLAAIGLSAFFPPRRYGDSAPDGTVGVKRRLFRYCTWSPHAPSSIARLCARGVKVAAFEGTSCEATIAMMGQYSYLKFARPAGVAGTATMSNDTTEEDYDDE